MNLAELLYKLRDIGDMFTSYNIPILVDGKKIVNVTLDDINIIINIETDGMCTKESNS